MKRFFLAFLFTFLIPVLAFANPEVNFSQSDTQLQGKQAKTLNAPYFSIILPSYLDYGNTPLYSDGIIAVSGKSSDGDFSIGILASENIKLCEILSHAVKGNGMITNEQIENVTLSNFTGTKVSGFVDKKNAPYQLITYTLSSKDKTFTITFCMNPKSYKSYLPLVNEIVNTLELKN